MAERVRVAILRTRPETALDDVARLFELAGARECLDPAHPTILKDNISWHFPMPGANTTPWQLEGTILALQGAGYSDLSCVQNETVVIDAFKDEDLNNYRPILAHYDIPILYNFEPRDMSWVRYELRAELSVLNRRSASGP